MVSVSLFLVVSPLHSRFVLFFLLLSRSYSTCLALFCLSRSFWLCPHYFRCVSCCFVLSRSLSFFVCCLVLSCSFSSRLAHLRFYYSLILLPHSLSLCQDSFGYVSILKLCLLKFCLARSRSVLLLLNVSRSLRFDCLCWVLLSCLFWFFLDFLVVSCPFSVCLLQLCSRLDEVNTDGRRVSRNCSQNVVNCRVHSTPLRPAADRRSAPAMS